MWLKWNELKEVSKGKKIVLFGCSDEWIPKTLPKLPNPSYIVDNNLGFNNTRHYGLMVYHPDKLKTESDVYIVITASPYESVKEQLEEYGFKENEHFCCSPAYYDFKLLQEIENYNKKLLISSPDYGDRKSRRYSKLGGGLYTYELQTHKLKRIIPGHFRQLLEIDDKIYAIDYVSMKLYILKDLDVEREITLNEPNICGSTYYPYREAIITSNPTTDVISIRSRTTFETMKVLKEHIRGEHHINDLCVVGNTLYAGCFSVSGNWRRGVLDGGIFVFDLTRGNPFTSIINNLWMPHSIKFIEGRLCYTESMSGKFYIGDHKVAGKFPGFMRGLTYDGRFYYIGQSICLYTNRLFGISDNIMLNAGFYLFDKETKVSRFYELEGLINIHDLVVL